MVTSTNMEVELLGSRGEIKSSKKMVGPRFSMEIWRAGKWGAREA